MQPITYNVKVDVMATPNPPRIEFTKGDIGGSLISFSVFNNNKPVSLSDKTVTVTIKKPDNITVVYDVPSINIHDNVADFYPDLNGLNVQGTVLFTFEIYEGLARITSKRMQYIVTDTLNIDDDVASFKDYPILTGLINEVQSLVPVEDERQEQELIRVSNENTRMSNEDERQEQELIRVSNENTRMSNEAARQKTEADRVTEFDSIKEAYDTATKENTLIEVVNARKGEVNLEAKINKIDSSLNESAKQFENFKTESREDIFSYRSIASKKKVVVFIDDDAYLEAFTKWKPIADEKGVKFSFCVITNRVGNAGMMTWEQIAQMYSEGFDVLSHTHNHSNLTLLSDAEKDYELRISKEILNSKGYKAEHIVYPGGNYNKASNDITRKYYKSGVAIGGSINKLPVENYVIARYDLDQTSLTTAKGLVDSLNNSSGVLVFMSHIFNNYWTDTKVQDLKDLIDYIKSLGIDILTWSDAFNHFGNVVEVGSKTEGQYFKVDPYGNIYNQNYDNFQGKRYARNSLTFATPPSYFTGNEISITDFNGASTETQFPETKLGTLVTISGYDTKWQYWYPYQSNSIYIRRKHNTSDTWLSFVNISPRYYDVTPNLGTIPANSTVDYDVSNSGVVYNQDVVTVNAHGSLPSGILVNAFVKSGNIVNLRVANITSSPVVLLSTQTFRLLFTRYNYT